MTIKKYYFFVLSCWSLSLSPNAIGTATNILNSNSTAPYPSADTKKEFIARLKNAYDRSKLLKEANDNQPYQDVEKTLQAEWKSGFIEKNPGKFALILLGSFGAIVALTIYASH